MIPPGMYTFVDINKLRGVYASKDALLLSTQEISVFNRCALHAGITTSLADLMLKISF